VENVYIEYNYSHFIIYLPQVIKIYGILKKFWQKQFCTVFLRHGVQRREWKIQVWCIPSWT